VVVVGDVLGFELVLCVLLLSPCKSFCVRVILVLLLLLLQLRISLIEDVS